MMPGYTAGQPPPLPPRSPRPLSAVYIHSPQQSVPASQRPPSGPPYRGQHTALAPPGPPPPIPPRPPGYEIRNASSPATAPVRPSSAIYIPASPDVQVNGGFPLPPPPPGPPPRPVVPVTTPTSPAHYLPQPTLGSHSSTGYGSPTHQGSGHSSPTTWTNLPGPPPGPPPRSPSSANTQCSSGQSPHPSSYIRPTSYGESPLSPSNSTYLPGHVPRLELSSAGQIRHGDYEGTGPTGGANISYEPPSSSSPAYDATDKPSSHASIPSLEVSKPASSLNVAPHVPQTATSASQPLNPSTSISPVSPSAQVFELETPFQSLNLSSTLGDPRTTLSSSRPEQGSAVHSANPARAVDSTSIYSSYQHQKDSVYELPEYGDTGQFVPNPTTLANPPTPRREGNAQRLPTLQQVPVPRSVTSCIDIPMAFATDWYWHPEAPDYQICSRCYVDHLFTTRFRDEFITAKFSDNKPRVCRFSKPRMKDHILKDAVKSGSLQSMLEWMRFRSQIPDCKGVDGVKGNIASGLQWYTPVSNAIPGFLSCQACYEDILMTNQFVHRFGSYSERQPPEVTWACDMPISFVSKAYERKGRLNGWANFVAEAQARMNVEPCPQRRHVPTYGKKWFAPRRGPQGLYLCESCHYDQVVHSGEEHQWEMAKDLSSSRRHKARCAMGMLNVRILMGSAHDKKDFAMFWRAILKIEREESCEEEGIANGIWYTLPSNPKGFHVCAGCYAGILEPLDVSRFWVRKHDSDVAASTGRKLVCCFNFAHPRLQRFMPHLLEMYFTLDPTSLERFASLYASTTPCLRDEDKPGLRWYGWYDCTICPECYLDFARHSPLAAQMELRDVLLPGSTVCDMYSKRMRALYTECGSSSAYGRPPDPRPLLEYSLQRQRVYLETVPRIRDILAQSRAALTQQKMLNTMSTYHNVMGHLDQITWGTPYVYSAPGVGYGFANMNALQGAAYGQQAMAIAANIGSGGHLNEVQQLEQRWRAVE